MATWVSEHSINDSFRSIAGLFTGISIITLVEVFYWGFCFVRVLLQTTTTEVRQRLKESSSLFGFQLTNTNSNVDVGSVETNIGSDVVVDTS